MPGSIVFKPVDIKFAKGHEPILNLDDTSFKFKIGGHSAGPLAPHAKWNDFVTVDRARENFASFKLQGNRFLGLGPVIGEGKVDLEMVMANKKLVYWFDILDKEEVIGQVLLDIEYYPPI